MRTIQVENAVKPVSKIILGTGDFRIHLMPENFQILDNYVELGGRTIDTAENYGLGQSETVIGKWMKERGNRDELLLITKGAHPYGEKRVNAAAITEDLLGSLKRLQTDYADIYMLHRDDPDVPVEPIIEVLNEHIKAGRIKVIGASNWSWQRISEANTYAKNNGLVGFSCSSVNLSLAKPNEPMWTDCVSADEATCRWHQETRMPLLSWSSQAGGFFTGRFSPDNNINADITRVYYSNQNWERYRRAQLLAERMGFSANQIALAYVLNQPFPTCGIIGPRSKEEMMPSFEALTLELKPEDIRWLDLSEEEVDDRAV